MGETTPSWLGEDGDGATHRWSTDSLGVTARRRAREWSIDQWAVRRPEERRRYLDGIRRIADDELGGSIERRCMTILYTARKPSQPTL